MCWTLQADFSFDFVREGGFLLCSLLRSAPSVVSRGVTFVAHFDVGGWFFDADTQYLLGCCSFCVMPLVCSLFFRISCLCEIVFNFSPCVDAARYFLSAPPPLPMRDYFLCLSLASAVYFIGGLQRSPTDFHHCKRSHTWDLGEYPHIDGLHATVKGTHILWGEAHLVVVGVMERSEIFSPFPSL